VETLPPTEAEVVDPKDQTTNVVGPLSPAEEAGLEDEFDTAAGQRAFAETQCRPFARRRERGGFSCFSTLRVVCGSFIPAR
jgi:hypothetical protein